jgi:hypothetical protein
VYYDEIVISKLNWLPIKYASSVMTLDIITSTCTGDWLSQEISSRNCHFAEKQQQPDRMARTVWTGLSGQDN